MPTYSREDQLLQQGSRTFPYSVPAVNHTQTNWYHFNNLFPTEATIWTYVDSIVIQNNSALPVHFYLNSTDNDYTILPFGVQPITRRACRAFGFYNPDAASDIAAGLILMNMRRLPGSSSQTLDVPGAI
jgi:hypothetical protein